MTVQEVTNRIISWPTGVAAFTGVIAMLLALSGFASHKDVSAAVATETNERSHQDSLIRAEMDARSLESGEQYERIICIAKGIQDQLDGKRPPVCP